MKYTVTVSNLARIQSVLILKKVDILTHPKTSDKTPSSFRCSSIHLQAEPYLRAVAPSRIFNPPLLTLISPTLKVEHSSPQDKRCGVSKSFG